MTEAWKLGRDALDHSSGIGPIWQRNEKRLPVVPTQFPPSVRQTHVSNRAVASDRGILSTSGLGTSALLSG